MSNILRRPMFRGGGKVSSYGNGIASGLAKPKRGLVDEPGGYAGFSNLAQFLANQAAGTQTGGNILSQTVGKVQGPSLSPQMQAIQDRLNPQPRSVMGRTIGQRLLDMGGRFVGANPLTATAGLTAATFLPVGIMAAANAPETVEALVYMKKMNESGIFDETSDPKAVNEYYETLEKLNKTGTRLEEKGVGLATSKEDLEKIINELNAPPPPPPPGGGRGGGGEETNMNTEETTELTVDDYIDLLGGKKARQRDVSDLFARISASALKRGERGEGKRTFADIASDVMAAEAAAGPSRLEKIEQTAGMLDIKDRQATKRALEQVDLMKAQEIFRRDISKGTIDDLYLAAKKTEGVPAAVAFAIKNTLPGYDNKEFEVVEAKDAKNRQLTESDIGKVIIRGNKSGTYTALEVIKKPDGTIDTKKIYTSL
jgi:hypothetical protein